MRQPSYQSVKVVNSKSSFYWLGILACRVGIGGSCLLNLRSLLRVLTVLGAPSLLPVPGASPHISPTSSSSSIRSFSTSSTIPISLTSSSQVWGTPFCVPAGLISGTELSILLVSFCPPPAVEYYISFFLRPSPSSRNNGHELSSGMNYFRCCVLRRRHCRL